MPTLSGLIIHAQSGFYTVQTAEGAWTCRLRGRLKRGPRQGDLAAVGDRVEITPLDARSGVIQAVEERQRTLERLAPGPGGAYRQVILANPDQLVLVFACAEPSPRLGMVDRFLVIAESQHIPALIVANKIDLATEAERQALFGHYPALGYPVFYTCALSGRGVDRLHEQLRGRISVLAGPSGVGKSSLLNAIQPGLGLEVSRVSQTTGRGRHTTVSRRLIPLEGGGYVADTPGLKALALWDLEPDELDGYFPELRSRVQACAYNDCRHIDEPGCAVLQAVAQGEIHPQRYRSYLNIRQGQGLQPL
jgi:ribosome biogenesis GTPase